MNTIKKEIKKDRLGESNIAKNGQVMTVIGYRKHTDIDIQFEDGTIVKHKSYYNFKYGNIKNPNIKEDRTGEINIANNGQSMTIIEYRKCTDIDVQFEDGTIVKNKSYINFKIGNIGNPNYVISGISYNELFCLEQLKQFGFRKVEKGELKGVELGNKELDLYNPALKIGIEYDGGAYTKEFKYHTIKRDIEKDLLCEKVGITLYRIRESQLPRYNSSSIKYYLEDNSRNSQNLIDTISLIVKDINLKFNTNFKYKYEIKEIKLEKIQSRMKRKRVGETNIATNGQIMTIIKYRNTNDIDIQFEDETIVKHKSYYNFKKGRIKNSKLAMIQLENKIGENSIAKNGQTMTIIEYRKYSDIDIQFEDGTIVTNKSYNNFKKGSIQNPNYKKNK